MQRRHLLQAGMSLAATGSTWAQAPTWPSKPITIVVPFPPGGSTDLIARTLATKMAEKLGAGFTFIVDNRAGATGTIGASQVARAPADGHTLFVSSLGPFVIAPHLIKVNYDALKDLDPITVVVQAPNVLVVPAASARKSVAEVISYLKANPDKMSFASSGNGSSDHLTAELFWQQTGTNGVHVPYKGGGPVMTDLLGNQVESSFMNINTALPDVPTLEESGVKEANVNSWQAVAAPRGLPADIKKRLYDAIVASIKDPAVAPKLLELGFEIVLNTPEQFAAYQASEYTRWQKLISSRNIKAD
jgi:tripartite-type tricarboxylate transporter receptor subunit TctC